MRTLTRTLFAATICALVAPSHAFAQGSAGGTIGKQNKSASGSEEAAPSAPKRRTATRPSGEAPAGKKGCGNFFGTWTSGGGSWLYGKNDTVFNSGGTARHTSGIVGTWTCKGGVVDLIWKDWDHDHVKLSDDGRRLDSLDGGKGFNR